MERRTNTGICLKFGNNPIITTNLHKRKVCVKCVLHTLRDKQNSRHATCKHFVETAGGEYGCINIINIADESWFSQCDPKQKNKEFKMPITQVNKTKLSSP
jgi:hypothetical protein